MLSRRQAFTTVILVFTLKLIYNKVAIMVVIVWYFSWICALNTKVVSSNYAHGEVYSIQHYVIKFDMSVVFSGTWDSSTNKTDRHDITKILLKVALNTITLTLTRYTMVTVGIKKMTA